MKKRILCLILAALMIVPFFATVVQASPDTPYAEITGDYELTIYFGASKPAGIGSAAGQVLSWIQLYDGDSRVSYGQGYVNYPVWVYWVDEANGIAKATDVWGKTCSLPGYFTGVDKIYKATGPVPEEQVQNFTLNDIKADGHPDAKFKLNLNLSGDQNAQGTVIDIADNYAYGVVNEENAALIHFGNYTPSASEIADSGTGGMIHWVQMYANNERVIYNGNPVDYPVWLEWQDKANNIAKISAVWGTDGISLFDQVSGTGKAYDYTTCAAGTKTTNEIAAEAGVSNWELRLNLTPDGNHTGAIGRTVTLKPGQTPKATVTGDNELTIDFGDIKVSGIGSAAGQVLSWVQLYDGDSRVSHNGGYVNYPVWVYWEDEANNIAKATDVWGKGCSLPGLMLGTSKAYKSDGTGLQDNTVNDIKANGHPDAKFKLNLNLSGDQNAQGRIIEIDNSVSHVLVNDENSALVYFKDYKPTADELPDSGRTLNWVQMYDNGARVSYNGNYVNYPVWLEWQDKANNIAKITPVWGTDGISLYDQVAGTGKAYDHSTAAVGSKTVNEIAAETGASNWEFKLNMNHSGDNTAQGHTINLILEDSAKAKVTGANEITIDFGNSRPAIADAAGQTFSWVQLYEGTSRLNYGDGLVNYPVWVYWTDKANGIAKATGIWDTASLTGLMLGTNKISKTDGTGVQDFTLNDIKADGHPNAKFKLNLNLSDNQSAQGKVIDIEEISTYGVVNAANSALIYLGDYTPSTTEIPDGDRSLNWVQMYSKGDRVQYGGDYVNYPVWLEWQDKANNIAKITPVWGTDGISLYDMLGGDGIAYAPSSDSAGTKTVNDIASELSLNNYEFMLNMNHDGNKAALGHTVPLRQGVLPSSKVISDYKTLIYFNDYNPTTAEVPDTGRNLNWIQLFNPDGSRVQYGGTFVNYPVWIEWYNREKNIAIATEVWDKTVTMTGYADGTGFAYDSNTCTACDKTVNEIRTLTGSPDSKFYINLYTAPMGDVNAVGTLIELTKGTAPKAQVVTNDKMIISLNDYEASAEEIPDGGSTLNWMILYNGNEPVIYEGQKVAFPVFLGWENKEANTVKATAVWGSSATIGGYVSGKDKAWNIDGTALLDVTIDDIKKECGCEDAQFKVVMNHSGDRNAPGTTVDIDSYIMPYVEIINRSEALIHFNSMKVYDSDIEGGKFIQYFKLQEDCTNATDMIMDAASGVYCQFGGTMEWYDKENNIMKYTYAQGDGQSLLKVYDGTACLPLGGTKTLNDWAQGYPNAKLRFNFNGNWIDVVNTFDINKIPHAELISDYQMLIYFKDMKVTDEDLATGLNNYVHYIKLQQVPVGSDMVMDLEKGIFCQFGGVVKWYDKENNVAIYTYAQGDDKKLTDIYYMKECPSGSDKTLKEWAAPYPNAEMRFNFNGQWMDIVDKSVILDESQYPHIKSAVATSWYTMDVEFTEPVEIEGNPFMALRILDENNNLVWHENGIPLQFPGIWEWANEEHTKMTFTMSPGGFAVHVKDISDVINRTGELAPFKDRKTAFVIEEVGDHEDGTIDNVYSAKTGLGLWANKVNPGFDGWDSTQVGVSEDYHYPDFYLKKATAINDKQILLEFTQPMKLDVANPFMALRIITDGNDLQFSEYNGQNIPLQWYGTFELYNPERTMLLWTIGPESQPFGVGNVYEILNLTGELQKFADMGYMTKFCIEEKFPLDGKDTEDGTIANFRSDSGDHLYANRIMIGDAWDGMYIEVDIDPNYVPPVVDTGDNFNIYITIGIMAVSVLSIGCVFVCRRRKKETD